MRIINRCENNLDKAALYRKGLQLEYFTAGYNALEALASIGFGVLQGSIALVGFGLDSVVESLSGLVLVWRLRTHGQVSGEEEERIERRAVRFVALSFFILGAYVLFESVKKLLLREIPQASLPGIIIDILSLLVMPLLALSKRRLGEGIGSKALIADSKETFACAFLSAALLIGLGVHYLFGFWQADPLVVFVIVVFLFKEGYEGWRESGRRHEA